MGRSYRYLVRLENSGNYKPKDTFPLMVAFRKESDGFGSVIKNMRVTEKAIEFDLYAKDENSKKKTIDQLSKNFGKFLNERDLREDVQQGSAPSLRQNKEETVKLGVDLFNEQRYWECHETLEQIWRREQNKEEKDVQQGFILAASALVHFQKNENDVCLNMIPRTLARLGRWLEPGYFSLNVQRLKENLERIKETKEIRPFKI